MHSNMGSAGESAEVIAFPIGPQAAERLRERKLAAAKVFTPMPATVYDGGWYHDEAIEEDRKAREGIRRLDH